MDNEMNQMLDKWAAEMTMPDEMKTFSAASDVAKEAADAAVRAIPAGTVTEEEEEYQIGKDAFLKSMDASLRAYQATTVRKLNECRIIATYAVGDLGDRSFVYHDLDHLDTDDLVKGLEQVGARPVGYVNVRQHPRFGEGKPQYHYTYFFPKNESCDCGSAGCKGDGLHEPKTAADAAAMGSAIEYIKAGSKGTGILPNRSVAEKNVAAAAGK